MIAAAIGLGGMIVGSLVGIAVQVGVVDVPGADGSCSVFFKQAVEYAESRAP